MQLLHFSIYVSFLIISTILYPIPRCFCAVDEVYTDCSSSFDCANLKNLSYPFWGSNRPVYCGHPDFKLVCDGENAEITITSQSYQVLEVRYSDYSFQVVRTDFWNNACPTQLENNSINYSLFDYGSDLQNLTLFYGCPFSSPYTSFTQFNCTINGTQMFDYFTVENILEDAETPEIQTWATCKSRVIIPILESQVSVLNESSTLENLEAAINKGFSLKSKANNDWCSKCQKSAGYCGYNPSSSEFSCYCRDGPSLSTCGSMKKRSQRLKTAIGISAGIGGIAIIFILIICSLKMHSRIKGKKITKETRVFHHHNLETFMEDHGSLAPKRYSYSKVKKMTKSFSNKLGQGGYGVVYKASLPDGRLVAIKVISESNGSGEEFLNEVASISRTSHVNIVTLLGFCYERNKKALIYEYMPNGSLDKFIYKKGSFNAICSLEWMTMYQISIGVARGLEYLHRGCNTRILHFDIKPQNILLDEDFCPKISDFGLAKICLKKESVVSILGARGTVGFIAPEVFSKTFGRVSHKSDVYSFGMLVLEMVGGRKNYDSGGSHSDEMYFPDWIYKDLEQGKILSNSLSITEEENEVVRKMTLVSLWCIQTNPLDRPSMSKVVEMLEGPLHSISFPPKPSLHSATATTSPLQFSDGSTIEILETDSISS